MVKKEPLLTFDSSQFPNPPPPYMQPNSNGGKKSSERVNDQAQPQYPPRTSSVSPPNVKKLQPSIEDQFKPDEK